MKNSTQAKSANKSKNTIMSPKKLVAAHQKHASDVMFFINVRCGIRQTSKSNRHTDKLLSDNQADEGVADVTLYKLPPEVKAVKKWIENTRGNVLYTSNGGKKYKHNGRLCALVSPEHQEEFLEAATEFVNISNRKILDAATDNDVNDRQAGYERMLDRMRKKSGDFQLDKDIPSTYQQFVANIKVYCRQVYFSNTADFKHISKAVQEAVALTEQHDACESYNGMVDGIENALVRALHKLKAINSAKPSIDNPRFKWPVLSKNILNSYLVTPMETYLPMIPSDKSTNPLFQIIWGLLGSTPEDMRQHFVDSGQIADTDEAWRKVLKKNPKYGKVNTGLVGTWEKLFDNERFEALPVNQHKNKADAKENSTALRKQTQIDYIMKHDRLGKLLFKMVSIVREVPRYELDR